MSNLSVLIACEFSGAVRDAFLRRGIFAISCDLEPTEVPGPHYRGDVHDILYQPWDLLIAFPPCTHLAASGAKWFAEKRADGRQASAIDFFLSLASAPIGRIAIENPIGIMSGEWRKPDQIIQPWQFGDPFEKTTCLWLHGLPPLLPTKVVAPEPRAVLSSGKSLPRWYNLPETAERSKLRSATFPGIAEAMADQWSKCLI